MITVLFRLRTPRSGRAARPTPLLRTRRLLCPLLLALMSALIAPAAGAQEVDGTGSFLKPGDSVRIQIWRGGDLGGDYAIDEDGNLQLPLIGTVPVAHLTTDSLKTFLMASYSRYLKDPYITVVPLFRINVMGEVVSPGLYPVDATLGLSDILALAGGATETGDIDKVMVVQNGNVVTKNLNAELEGGVPVTRLGIRSGDQIVVGRRGGINARDWAIVASMISASAIVFDVIRR